MKSKKLKNKFLKTNNQVKSKKIKKTKDSKDSKLIFIGRSPKRNKDLPVYQGQFEELRNELNAKFTSMNLEFKALRKDIDTRFIQVDSRFDKMDAQFSEVLASIHRVQMIVEEQNNRNKFVLDGFANLHADLEEHKSENQVKFYELESLLKLQK